MKLICILALTLILVPLAMFTTGPLRIVVGLLFILFFPGYALMAALFPQKDRLHGIERVALSFVLSFAIVPLTGLVLNFTPWGIRLESILIGIAVFIVIALLISLYRQLGIPEGQRFEPHLPIKLPRLKRWRTLDRALRIVLLISITAIVVLTFFASIGWMILEFFDYTPWGISLELILISIAVLIVIALLIGLFWRLATPEEQMFKRFGPRLHIKMPHFGGGSLLDRAISIVLLLAILGAIGGLTYAVANPSAEEPFTEFYILGSEGMAEDYPREVGLGEQVEVTTGIVNHENQYMSYKVEVEIEGEKLTETVTTSLEHEEEWRDTVTFIPSKAGVQKAEFQLYKGVETEPYLTLHLWLDVKEAE